MCVWGGGVTIPEMFPLWQIPLQWLKPGVVSLVHSDVVESLVPKDLDPAAAAAAADDDKLAEAAKAVTQGVQRVIREVAANIAPQAPNGNPPIDADPKAGNLGLSNLANNGSKILQALWPDKLQADASNVLQKVVNGTVNLAHRTLNGTQVYVGRL